MDGQTDVAEFIRPFGRTGGPVTAMFMLFIEIRCSLHKTMKKP